MNADFDVIIYHKYKAHCFCFLLLLLQFYLPGLRVRFFFPLLCRLYLYSFHTIKRNFFNLFTHYWRLFFLFPFFLLWMFVAFFLFSLIFCFSTTRTKTQLSKTETLLVFSLTNSFDREVLVRFCCWSWNKYEENT